MNDIVKCSNKNCGLIADVNSWLKVRDEKQPNVFRGHCPRCFGETYFLAKPGEKGRLVSGDQLIAFERKRHVRPKSEGDEGWTPEHDDEHINGELPLAGASYAALAGGLARHPEVKISSISAPKQWPWDESWWKPSNDNIKNLVRAGALIAAEIDRLQRLNKQG